MTWLFGIHTVIIVLIIQTLQTTNAQISDDTNGGPYQCHCSCSSRNNPNTILMTTGNLRRQGSVAIMDSMSIKESSNDIKNLLESAYQRLTRTLSDIDRNHLAKLRDSLQVQSGGKMPKDMAVTIVDLFKKALYPEENSTTNGRNVPDVPKASLSNSNGYVFENMQAVIEKQQTGLKQWQRNEQNKKVNKQQQQQQQQKQQPRQQQQKPNITKPKTQSKPQPKAYTLRTLNSLIKSATERLVEIYGKAQAKRRQNASSRSSQPERQQAFRNEPQTVDAVRGKLHPSYTSDNHGFWTQEKGSILNSNANKIEDPTVANSEIGPNTQPKSIQTKISSLNNSKIKNINTTFYEVPGTPPATSTPSSIAYYQSNAATAKKANEVKSKTTGSVDKIPIKKADLKNILDLNLSKKMSNVGPSANSALMDAFLMTNNMMQGNLAQTKNSALENALLMQNNMKNNLPQPENSALADALLMQNNVMKNNLPQTENSALADALLMQNKLMKNNLPQSQNSALADALLMQNNLPQPQNSALADALLRQNNLPELQNSALADALLRQNNLMKSNLPEVTNPALADAALLVNNMMGNNLQKPTNSAHADALLMNNNLMKSDLPQQIQEMTSLKKPGSGDKPQSQVMTRGPGQQTYVDTTSIKQPSLKDGNVLQNLAGVIGTQTSAIVNPSDLQVFPEQTIQSPLGNEWGSLLKQTGQTFIPSSNVQTQNFRNNAQELINISEFYKLLHSLTNNQNLDPQYSQRSTSAPNNADHLAMAMMLGAWRK